MISVDNPEDNRKFALQEEADFPMLSDPEKKVAAAYGVLGPSGLARRWTFYIGPDGRITYIEKMVRPATSGDDIVTKLTELKVARARQ